MSVKLLTEHHLELLSLKRGCTVSSESTLVKSRCHIVENHVRGSNGEFVLPHLACQSAVSYIVSRLEL